MTKEEAAAQLDGNQYGKEGSSALWAAMKAAGLVAAFGASDDLLEFRGAIDDEVGAYGGHSQPILPTGLPKNECEDDGCPYFEKTLKGAASVEAEWHDQGDGPCWAINSAIPHVTFSVFEDGEPYCQGIVFALADVPATASSVAVPAAASECLAFFASCIKSGEAWSPTCEEMYAKAKAAIGSAA